MSRKIIIEGTIAEIKNNIDTKREEFNEKSFPIVKKIIEDLSDYNRFAENHITFSWNMNECEVSWWDCHIDISSPYLARLSSNMIEILFKATGYMPNIEIAEFEIDDEYEMHRTPIEFVSIVDDFIIE
jgi:hypothetical protein